MRNRLVIALGLAALLSTSCVPSIQRLIEEGDAVEEPRLVGTWVDGKGGDYRRLPAGETTDESRLVLKAREDRAYDMEVLDEDGTVDETYIVRVARFSSGTFLEMVPADKACWDVNSDLVRYVRTSNFYRIKLEGDVLHYEFFDTDWLKKKLDSHAINLPHVVVDDNVVLTASSKQLQRFVERHADDPGAMRSVE